MVLQKLESNSPVSMMNRGAKCVQYVDFERRDLTHHLSGVQKFLLRDFMCFRTVSRVQVNSLDQLHVVQKRVESHEVGEAHLPLALGES